MKNDKRLLLAISSIFILFFIIFILPVLYYRNDSVVILDIEDVQYEVKSVEQFNNILREKLPRGLILRTIYDKDREMFLPFEEIGVSYLAPKDISNIRTTFDNSYVNKIRRFFSFGKKHNVYNLNKHEIYFDEQVVRRSILESVGRFDYLPRDPWIYNENGTPKVVSSEHGYEVVREYLADSIVEALKDRNYYNVYIKGKEVPPKLKDDDLKKYNKIVISVISKEISDEVLQDAFLYVFSSLNNEVLFPGEQISISETLSTRMKEIKNNNYLDHDSYQLIRNDVSMFIDDLFQSFSKHNFHIDYYSTENVSIGVANGEKSKDTVLVVSNNMSKAVVLACYLEDDKLNFLVVSE